MFPGLFESIRPGAGIYLEVKIAPSLNEGGKKNPQIFFLCMFWAAKLTEKKIAKNNDKNDTG